MRTLLCLALVPAALACAPLACAAIGHGAAMDLKRNVEGQYRLANGRGVRLTLVNDQLYLYLNRCDRSRIEPVGERVLASRDGRLTVQYMPDGPGERILIRHSGLPTSVRLGERNWRGR